MYKDHPVPIYEKPGLSSMSAELDAGNTLISSDKKGYAVDLEPVEMESDHV